MRVDVLEQNILVDLSPHDEGGSLGNKKFLCSCHHVMKVNALVDKRKILVEVSSHCDKV